MASVILFPQDIGAESKKKLVPAREDIFITCRIRYYVI